MSPAPHQHRALTDGGDAYGTTLTDLASALSGVSGREDADANSASDIAASLRNCATRIRALGHVDADQWPGLYHAAIDVLNAAEFVRE